MMEKPLRTTALQKVRKWIAEGRFPELKLDKPTESETAPTDETPPCHKGSGVTLYCGDCTTVKPQGLFHAMLCDPPYHLTSPVSKSGSRPTDEVSESKFNRFNAGGFMGKKWDGGDIAFNPETWRKLSEYLHPGAFIMAFASSRGWHRLACAIEDAGFIIHPTIFGWACGSGFPKATRVKDSMLFTGHRYGLQALKPSLEPIIVAQKPYQGKSVDCITKTGAGALNVDGGRIAGDVPSVPQPKFGSPTGQIYGFKAGEGRNGEMSHATGRWPANFILLDAEAAATLDRQSGDSHDGLSGASRYFYRVQSQLDEADPIRYQARASRKERDAGLDKLEATADTRKGDGLARVCEFCGARQFPYPELCKCPTKSWVLPKRRNNHPTVKPIDLCRYLATLLLPPKEYAPRRILVPFSGVASEMIGAMLAGWEEVVGMEQDAEYCEIAKGRIKYYLPNGESP